MNLVTFLKTYGTDEACRAHMESVRWPDGPVCPQCGTIGQAGVFRCHSCKAQFSVTVGTAMEGTHLPLNIWYLGMYLMLSTAKPISAMSLHRQTGIQYRTCWHLLAPAAPAARHDGRRRGHDAGERIARCLIGRHGRLSLKALFA